MNQSNTTIVLEEKKLQLPPGATVLESALDNNINIPNSCRSGLCQNCLIKIVEGDIPKEAQAGLSDNQKLQGYALACQFKPVNSIKAILNQDHRNHPARVIDRAVVGEAIVRLRLQSDISWYPGQYLTLWKDDHIGRPYSIASLPEQDFIECHVAAHQHGLVSSWIKDQLQVGANLTVGAPVGECFYTPSMQRHPLLLVGYGTGLAPLYGIVRDALNKGHQQPIHLYAAARTKQSMYMIEELTNLAQSHPNFRYIPVTQNAIDSKSSYVEVTNTISQSIDNLQDWCVFLCGAPELVKKLQKLCFLLGASLKDIHADPFISLPIS